MRYCLVSILYVICWFTPGIVLSTGEVKASSQSDISNKMAKVTVARIKEQYGLELPFFTQVLTRVPIRKASPAFLTKYGSSMGIYINGRIYLDKSLFSTHEGLNIDSKSALAIIIHEAWHAYYELLIPKADKDALDETFNAHYNRNGMYPEEEWTCFGDEAIGNYYADLVAAYVFAAETFREERKITAGALGVYTRAFAGRHLYGYGTDQQPAPFAMSAIERILAQRIAGGAFPSPEKLSDTLMLRLGAPGKKTMRENQLMG